MKDGYGKYGESGNGATPKLGRTSTVDGLARPGSGGNAPQKRVSAPGTNIPKVARPGGPQGTKGASSGKVTKVARPGGAQGWGHSSR